MAKTTGKKPSAQAKSSRAGSSASSNHKKKSGASAKMIKQAASKKAPSRSAQAKAAPAKHNGKPASLPRLSEKSREPEKSRKAEQSRNGQKVKLPEKSAPGRTAKPVRASAEPSAREKSALPHAPLANNVPASVKPGKNQAGLSSRDIEHFRELLLAKRRELMGDMSAMESEALRSSVGSNLSNLPIHMADMGTDNYEQEFTLGLVQKDRDLVKEINAALAKIKNGTYGLCEATGLPIDKVRLEYVPWVRFSAEHQRKLERHGR